MQVDAYYSYPQLPSAQTLNQVCVAAGPRALDQTFALCWKKLGVLFQSNESCGKSEPCTPCRIVVERNSIRKQVRTRLVGKASQTRGLTVALVLLF